MITVIVTVVCKPNQRVNFLKEFHAIVPEVLKEDGCIEYGPTIDASTGQDNQNTDKNRVTIVEKWTSLPSLNAHLVAPHMEAYRPKVQDFIESAEFRILESA